MVLITLLIGAIGIAHIAEALFSVKNDTSDAGDKNILENDIDANQNSDEQYHLLIDENDSDKPPLPDQYVAGTSGSDLLYASDEGNVIYANGEPLQDTLEFGNVDLDLNDLIEAEPDYIEGKDGDDIIRFSTGDLVRSGVGDDLLCFYHSGDEESESAKVADFSLGDTLVVFSSSLDTEEVDVVDDGFSTSIFIGDSKTPSVDIFYSGTAPSIEMIQDHYDSSQNLREFLYDKASNTNASVFLVRYLN